MGSLPPPSASLPAPPRFEPMPRNPRDERYPPPPREENFDRRYVARDVDDDRIRPDYDRDRRWDDRNLPSARGVRPRSPEVRGKRRLYDRENRSIEERIQLERPCRTLFVRNVQYEADPMALREQFESYGQIKNFYEMIHNRGMIFITYYDLRSAQRARDAMHGLQLSRRPIDVHYSLPRTEEISTACDQDKNQGTVLVVNHPPRPLDLNEISRVAGQYGDIKDLVSGRVPSEAIVEYYDSRGADLFVKNLDRQPFMGGGLELRYMWDRVDSSLPPPASDRYDWPPAYDDPSKEPPRNPPGYGDNRNERFESRGGTRDRSPDYRDRRGSYQTGYGAPPSAGRYSDVPPSASVEDDRLQQALKVQQLLNKLGNVNLPPTSATPPMPPPPINKPAYSSSAPIPSNYRPSPGPPPVQSYPPPAPSAYPPYTGQLGATYPPPKPPVSPYPPFPPVGGQPGQVRHNNMGMLPRGQPSNMNATSMGSYARPPPAAAPSVVKDVGSLLAMLQGKPQ
ncbi:hypothetical protein L204_104355 [Cryptococcus depauperatus]